MNDGSLDLERWFPAGERDAWRKAAIRALKGRSPEDVAHRTDEGISLDLVYGPDDVPVGGQYPEQGDGVRGARGLDRRRAGWDVRQEYAGLDLDELASAIAAGQARGVTSVWLRLDGRLRRGADVPETLPDGDGIYLRDAGDLRQVLGDVATDRVPVVLDGGAMASVGLGLLLAAGCRTAADVGSLSAEAMAVLPGGVAAQVEEYLRRQLRFTTHGPGLLLSEGGAQPCC